MFKGIPNVMKWVLGVLAGIILCEVIFAFTAGTQKEAIAADGASDKAVASLKVSGTALTDGTDTLCFRGISYGWHNIWPRFYNAGSLRTLHNDWGCRIFRAAIGADSHALADNPTALDGYMGNPEAALECLYNVVDGAIAEGCYVIVDWHSHTLHTEAAREFFSKVAAKYAGVPNVIYELFNEPVSSAFEAEGSYAGTSEEEYVAYWKQLKEYAAAVIEVIREAENGYEPLILMGCPMWDQRIDLPAADPVEGYSNLMYTVHFYAATHKDYLRESCDRALEAGCPIFISECGGCEASGDGGIDVDSWNAWTSWAASKGISIMTWSVSDKNETCSMFTREASSEGPWPDEVIKPWGSIVKQWIAR